MKLVIVESPTKAKTIGKFLGKDFVIRASMGHVMDLPKSTLGVDVDNNFTPGFELSVDKKKTVAELKKLAKEATEVILATDPDREGEAISAHIKEILENSKSNKKFTRIVFHEITKTAIEEALSHPGEVNMHLVDAQTARRVLDRLVGYKISPVLWQKVRRGLSAGRVQSVALRLIVEREKEITKFSKEKFWTVTAWLSSGGAEVGTKFSRSAIEMAQGPSSVQDANSENSASSPRHTSTPFELIEIDGKKIEEQQSFPLYDGKYTVTKTNIVNLERSQEIVKDLQTKQFIVRAVLEKKNKRSPLAPFTTSTLQQEAARRLGYSGKRTMSLAQKLYEEGLITYHRTDSFNLAASAVTNVRSYIQQMFGNEYLPEKPRYYITKQKLAQEAHEAIRPTKVEDGQVKVQDVLGNDYAKLYDLIWRRFVACQMNDALTESTTVLVDGIQKTHITQNTQMTQGVSKSENQKTRNSDSPSLQSIPDYTFKTTGSVLVFDGFLKVMPYGLQDKNLPKFTALESLDLQDVLADIHETTPPPRYNDASLIGALEDEGIGRPSTYASIISTIQDRQYVEKDQGKFFPTSIGTTVTEFLVKNFPDIDDIPFTAKMENELDAIANEGKSWHPMMQEFYTPFAKQLEQVKSAERIGIPTEDTGEICPKDGAPLVIRVGKFGKFVSCKNFPTCEFKKQFVEETNFTCPKDGGKVIVKKTKKGRTFYGCGNYPTCTFAVWKLTELKPQDTPATA